MRRERLAVARDAHVAGLPGIVQLARTTCGSAGSTRDEARFVARADRWIFGLGIGIDLLRPKLPEAGTW